MVSLINYTACKFLADHTTLCYLLMFPYRIDEVAGHAAGDCDEYHPADPLDESPVWLGDVL